MINKTYFGKRIASRRRALGLSQEALAERLGVTAQAVSKWETAAALPDVELLLELSHLYGVTVNDLLEEQDLVKKLATQDFQREEIALFPSAKEVYPQWARDMEKEGWIPRNWREAMEGDWPLGRAAAVRIAERGGSILELGAGPGGGFMPYVLAVKPDAGIVVSDLSPTVVRLWKAFLDRELDSPYLSFAAFNFCQIPFRDNSFDVVTDRGGIANAMDARGNAEDKGRALREAYRVLKPGGLLVTTSGFVTRETAAALPKNAREALQDQFPDVFQDLYEETVLAGFSKIDSVVAGHWDTDSDESGVADLARSLGINLRFTGYLRYCVK